MSVLALVLGCGGAEPVALLDPEALAPAQHDPLASHQPDEVACPEAAWGPEGGAFEVQTGVCSYAAFDQPLPVELRAGDLLAVTVWHDFLDAPEPSEGHVAVVIGDQVVWDAQVHIPALSASLEGLVELADDPPPDARLGVHLHNHGYNSWRFVGIDRVD